MIKIEIMKLNEIMSGSFDATAWEAKGYQLPKFDIEAVRRKTHDTPTWVHFGGGNIFRAFPAAILNDALPRLSTLRLSIRHILHITTFPCLFH